VQEPVEYGPLGPLGTGVDLDPSSNPSDQQRRHVQADHDFRAPAIARPRALHLLVDRHRRMGRAARRILGRLQTENRHQTSRRHLFHAAPEVVHLGDEAVQRPAGL
jgi:hypothetical protein